jgi:hypothetical protein
MSLMQTDKNARAHMQTKKKKHWGGGGLFKQRFLKAIR